MQDLYDLYSTAPAQETCLTVHHAHEIFPTRQRELDRTDQGFIYLP